MANPTVWKIWVYYENPDGTRSEVKESHRKNGDISIIHLVKRKGRTLLVLHYVRDSSGNLLSDPHEKYRDPHYKAVPRLWEPPQWPVKP
jgi:hypothetical protein